MFRVISTTSGEPVGRPHGSKTEALRAARGYLRNVPDRALSVVWCKEGVPKLWLANLDASGVHLTKFWAEVA